MKRTAKNIILLNEVESTNNYANQLILSNAAEEGTVVLAQYQKKGKGQQGNSWESENGKNLLMSIILFPQFLNAGKQFLLSKLVSLAIVKFLQSETEEAVSIKWPNDIYSGEKKIAGILIENAVKGQNLYSSVVGVGLNLNQEFFFSDAPNPVSLKQITGIDYDSKEVADKIIHLISGWYEKLREQNFNEINNNYISQLYKFGEWNIFSKQGKTFEAKIIGIGDFGQLILEDRGGKTSEFMFKEVEFVL